jgi:hypothetical protein
MTVSKTLARHVIADIAVIGFALIDAADLMFELHFSPQFVKFRSRHRTVPELVDGAVLGDSPLPNPGFTQHAHRWRLVECDQRRILCQLLGLPAHLAAFIFKVLGVARPLWNKRRCRN